MKPLSSLLPKVEQTNRQPDTESPQCMTCSDRGFVQYDVPISHALFGKLVPCPADGCSVRHRYEQQRYKQLIALSDISYRYKNYTFDSWQRDVIDTGKDRGKRLAYHVAQLIMERAGQSFWLREAWERAGVTVDVDETDESRCRFRIEDEIIWDWHIDSYASGMLLIGKHGVGKTGLVAATANAILQQRRMSVVFTVVPSLMERIKNTYNSSYTGRSREEMIRPLIQADIAIFDEFGLVAVPKQTTHTLNIMREIISTRWQTNRVMIATSNVPLHLLEDQWEGIILRSLRESCHIIEMEGEVLRRQNTQLPSF